MTPLDISMTHGLTLGVLVCTCIALWLRLISAWKLEKGLREEASLNLEQRNEAMARVGHLETELAQAGGDLSRQETQLSSLEQRMRELTAATLSAQTPEALGAVLRQAHGDMERLIIHLDVSNVTLPRTDEEIGRYLDGRGCSIAILKAREASKLADVFIRTPVDWKRTTQTGTFELISHNGFFSVGGLLGNRETGRLTVENPDHIEPGHIRRRML